MSNKANARALWQFTGDVRPAFAQQPGPGEESVWDYPRPPRLVPDAREVVIRVGEVEIARTRRALRMLETASPPTFYIPFADADRDCLVAAPQLRSTGCEWKGGAQYLSVVAGDQVIAGAAWWYPSPNAPYEAIARCFSVYPGRVACFVGGEAVRPQDGGFYGGWVTREIVGPWKGGPGTAGW